MPHAVYRDGRVHVMAKMCETCIFHPGNIMQLQPGRVEQMVRDAPRKESCIPCHETTGTRKVKPAVCAGFFRLHATQPLQVAQRLGYITFVKNEGGK